MRVAIYARVSTSEQAQDGYSIPAQISLLKDYSKAYGYNIIKIYTDAGISGKNIKDRPALCNLLKDAKNKDFDTVLVWKLSRLSRSLLDLLSIVDTLSKNNISLLSYTEKFDTSTPVGKMLLQLLGSIAEFERNTIVENVKMGLNERFNQGHSKGSIPFGYKYHNKKAVIVESQADIVRYVFDTFVHSDGNCLTSLAEKLNANGFRTRTGGLWQRTTIRDMLQNHFYAGYVRTGVHPHGYRRLTNAKVAKGIHEPIVSEEVFNLANEMLIRAKQKKVIRFPENDSVLTGLITCPLCGAKMFALNTVNKHKTKKGQESAYPVRMYRCNNKDKGKGVCRGIYISANKVEPFVVKAISDYIDSKDYLNRAISQPSKNAKYNENNEIEQVNIEIKKTKALMDKYFKLFELSEEMDSPPFVQKINGLYKKIEQLEKKKSELMFSSSANTNNISDFFSEINCFSDVYDNLPNSRKKELLRLIIKSITITKDKRVESVQLTDGNSLTLLS